jgi:hypothetical protein
MPVPEELRGRLERGDLEPLPGGPYGT